MKQTPATLDHAFSPETFRALGHGLVDRLADHLHAALNRDLAQTQPWKSPEQNLKDWSTDFQEGPSSDFMPFIESLLRDSIRLHHPRYMGHQVSAPLPMAALLDLTAALLNNSMAVYEMGPAGSAMEINVIKWLGQRLGFSSECGGVLTSGGTLGTLTALLAARQAKAGHDVWNDGVGQNKLAIITSEQCHYCASRAAKVMGLGSDGVITVPSDDSFRISAQGVREAFAQADARGIKVFAVVASACSTATGSFDPIHDIADVCRERDVWLHVDGAHGAAAILSDKYRHLLKGVERADSVVWDAHKMNMMPSLVTAVIFKNDADSYKTFAQQAPYLLNRDTAMKSVNQAERSYECTKRAMAFKLYGAFKLLGTRVFSDHIDKTFDLARSFAAMLEECPDFELAVAPESNIVCFRYKPDICPDPDALNAQIRQKLLESGRFYIVQTKLPRGMYLRVTLMNSFTTTNDLAELLDEIRKTAAETLSTRL